MITFTTGTKKPLYRGFFNIASLQCVASVIDEAKGLSQ